MKEVKLRGMSGDKRQLATQIDQQSLRLQKTPEDVLTV